MAQSRNPKDGVNSTAIKYVRIEKARTLQRKQDAVSAKQARAVKRATAAKPIPLGTAPARPTGRRPAPTLKPTAKPKKPLTSSEKAFLEGQKKKAQITKKTGVYPNTAN